MQAEKGGRGAEGTRRKGAEEDARGGIVVYGGGLPEEVRRIRIPNRCFAA